MLTEHYEDKLPSVFLNIVPLRYTLYTQVNSTILKKAQFNFISCDLSAVNMFCIIIQIYCKIEVYPTCREFKHHYASRIKNETRNFWLVTAHVSEKCGCNC